MFSKACLKQPFSQVLGSARVPGAKNRGQAQNLTSKAFIFHTQQLFCTAHASLDCPWGRNSPLPMPDSMGVLGVPSWCRVSAGGQLLAADVSWGCVCYLALGRMAAVGSLDQVAQRQLLSKSNKGVARLSSIFKPDLELDIKLQYNLHFG